MAFFVYLPLSLHSQTALPKGEPLSDFKPEFDPRNYTLIKINVVQTYNKALLPGELAAQTPERSLTLNLLFLLICIYRRNLFSEPNKKDPYTVRILLFIL